MAAPLVGVVGVAASVMRLGGPVSTRVVLLLVLWLGHAQSKLLRLRHRKLLVPAGAREHEGTADAR